MKKITIIMTAICALLAAVSLAACGGSSPATTAAAPETTAAETAAAPEETTAATADISNPSITIELGDAAAIEDLAKKAQNFEIEEGTVVKISGLFSSGISTPAIQEEKEAGSYVGINMYIDGDFEAPADKTEIEVVGSFVKGSYFMEFHVAPENITVK